MKRRSFFKLFAAIAAVGTMDTAKIASVGEEEVERVIERPDGVKIGDRRLECVDEPYGYFAWGTYALYEWNGDCWRWQKTVSSGEAEYLMRVEGIPCES